jgi:hypothetical protein
VRSRPAGPDSCCFGNMAYEVRALPPGEDPRPMTWRDREVDARDVCYPGWRAEQERKRQEYLMRSQSNRHPKTR